MATILKKVFRPPKARLSRRIVFWVFISVIVIETIILIPSYKRREMELLSHLKDVSTGKVLLIMQMVPPGASDRPAEIRWDISVNAPIFQYPKLMTQN
jgi:hypothetical protein